MLGELQSHERAVTLLPLTILNTMYTLNTYINTEWYTLNTCISRFKVLFIVALLKVFKNADRILPKLDV